MPRGDGQGPPDGARRGYGRGGGRGKGCGWGRGQGQRARDRCRTSRRGQAAGPADFPSAVLPTRPESLERTEKQAAATEKSSDVPNARGAEPPSRTATLIAHVDEEACTPCGACQAVCPTDAITLGEAIVKVNAELCCGCGACAEVCPSQAIRLF
jgi:ferredoxin